VRLGVKVKVRVNVGVAGEVVKLTVGVRLGCVGMTKAGFVQPASGMTVSVAVGATVAVLVDVSLDRAGTACADQLNCVTAIMAVNTNTAKINASRVGLTRRRSAVGDAKREGEAPRSSEGNRSPVPF
jgi:hypothetical protein